MGAAGQRALLTDAQRLDWLRLFRTDGVGPRTFRALVNRFGSARAALEALPEVGAKAGRPVIPCSLADAQAEMAAAARLGVRFLALGEEFYPYPLSQIADPPPLIAARGEVAILKRPSVAMVGSRNASASGLRFAEILARGVGEGGYVVVSGLARGIDAKAHEAALETGTIAVLAGGQDRLYPPENEPLAERILASGGSVLSEMPMGWTPRGRDFPRRNRIVAGLALGTMVVEAARKSGSLITARFALEQGRDVFAAPGSPLDPRAEGANDLIRQGAALVTEPAHILDALSPLLPPQAQAGGLASGVPRSRREPMWDELDLSLFGDAQPGEESPAPPPSWDGLSESATLDSAADPRDVVVGLLSASPTDIDELSRLSDLPIRTVRAAVAELDLGGRIERHGANRVSLRPGR